MQQDEQLNESVEDVLDLFPDEGELFSMSENEKIVTPNEKILPKVDSSYQKNPSPIEFEDTREWNINSLSARPEVKLAVTARLGMLLLTTTVNTLLMLRQFSI